ncbi:MAG: CoA transferase [Chloroflexi bacterium]|nr:CoA transferase [Chloroflexota bacterium]
MALLEGVTVVSLEQAVAAPFATRQLGDLGARVIKIERPGGGDFARRYDGAVHGESSYFVWLSRGKESLELDLRDPKSAEVMERLLAKADVFVQNLAPGGAAKLGYGVPALQARYPRLVCCSISGYGPDGPYRDRKAYDLLIQCEAGLLSITGTEDEMCRSGISVADISAGVYAYSGILAALYERERTGVARSVEVSMLEALGEWMTQPANLAAYGSAPRRSGPRHFTVVPYGPYAAKDGGIVFLSVQNETEWANFADRVMGRPDLAQDARFSSNLKRTENRTEVERMVAAACARWTEDELVRELDAADIACARVRDMAGFRAHPQLEARGRWRDIGLPGGAIARASLPPVDFGGFTPPMGDIPSAGEHTAAILKELGF